LPPDLAHVLDLPEQVLIDAALAGGDDYLLAFTVAPSQFEAVRQRCAELSLTLSCIGSVRAGEGVLVLDANGNTCHVQRAGFNHFGDARAD